MNKTKAILISMDCLLYPQGGKMFIFGMLYPETNKVALEAMIDGFNPEPSEVVWKFKNIDGMPFKEGKFVIAAKEHLLLGPPFSRVFDSQSESANNPHIATYEMKTILKLVDQNSRYNIAIQQKV